MRAIEAVARLDALLPNAYGTQMKLDWLAELEGMLAREIHIWHEAESAADTGAEKDGRPCAGPRPAEGEDAARCACAKEGVCACAKQSPEEGEGTCAQTCNCACAQQDAAFGPDSPLSVYEPYTGLYGDYLAAQVHYHDAEYGRYTNAMIRFNSAVAAYAADYTRRHRPRQAHKIRFGGKEPCSCRPL